MATVRERDARVEASLRLRPAALRRLSGGGEGSSSRGGAGEALGGAREAQGVLELGMFTLVWVSWCKLHEELR